MIKIENTDRLIAAIVDALENIKGENIRILDLREIENAVCKYFIICSGGSNTQVNALAWQGLSLHEDTACHNH